MTEKLMHGSHYQLHTQMENSMRATEIIKRILITCAIIQVYCIIWMALEYFIYGAVENRLVDNIMMLLFAPIVYRGTKGE